MLCICVRCAFSKHSICHETLPYQMATLSIIADAEKHGLSGHE